MSDAVLYKCPSSELLLRRGTHDDLVIREIFEQRCYRRATLLSGDVILDIGGNIGASAVYFARRAMSERKTITVHTFEPDAENLDVLRRNVEVYSDVICVHPQAIGSVDGVETLWVNTHGPNKGRHTTIEKRGYTPTTVQTLGLLNAVRETHCTVIKCDIEGGEFFLPWSELRDESYVREIIMETHMERDRFRRLDAPRLVQQMSAGGFQQATQRRIEGNTSNFNFVTLWKRTSDVDENRVR